jgi:hypothetical protein
MLATKGDGVLALGCFAVNFFHSNSHIVHIRIKNIVIPAF